MVVRRERTLAENERSDQQAISWTELAIVERALQSVSQNVLDFTKLRRFR